MLQKRNIREHYTQTAHVQYVCINVIHSSLYHLQHILFMSPDSNTSPDKTQVADKSPNLS